MSLAPVKMQQTTSRPLWKRILTGFAYVVVCGLALVFGTAMGYVGQSPTMSAFAKQMARQTPPQEIFNNSESVTLLILGCDEDLYYGGKQVLKEAARSDMMLLVRLDFTANRITAISIPRDLWVDMPGYRGHKINAFHAIGGPALAQQAVTFMTDVPVDRVIVLNYTAFQEMVDLVGGITVFVPKHLKYTDRAGGLFIDIKPGRQHLSGYDAMGFVRFRKGDSDFARQDRQKEFLLAFKQAVFEQPSRVRNVVEKSREVMGNALSPDELAALALFARKVGGESIKMDQLPVTEGSGTNLIMDRRAARNKLRELYFFGSPEPASTTVGQR